MPKYDAFGREIGDDTLAGLGGSSKPPDESVWQERTEREEATWEAAEKVEVARLETEADAADAQAEQAEDARQEAAGASYWTASSQTQVPTLRVKRSGAAKGCLVAFAVLIAVGGAIVAGIASLVGSVDIKGGVDAITTRPELQRPQEAPKGLEGKSLARPAALGAALRELRTSGGGKLTNLRVAPERIDATLLTGEGRLRHVQVKPGGDLERFGPDSGAGFDSVSTIPYSLLRPAAVERLTRRGAEEVGVPVSEFQYAVPQLFDGKVRWVVYFTRARYVIGNARGRFEREYPIP